MNKKDIEIGDIIQLTENAQEGWVGCLMIVSEVRSWGVLAYLKIPWQGDAFLRINFEDFEIVGRACLIHPNHDVEKE